MNLWQDIRVRLDFVTPLCGGIPQDQSAVEAWVRARAPKKAPADPEKSLEEITSMVRATIPPEDPEAEEMGFHHTGFQVDDRGLYVRGANLRAHLKDCAAVLGQQMRAGSTLPCKMVQNFRKKLIDRLYIAEEKLYLQHPETLLPVVEPSGHIDSTPNVMTPMGPRSILKRVDYCHPVCLTATLKFLPGGEISEKHIEPLFQYGMIHGFGQDRSLQYGQYNYTMLD